MSTSSNPDKVRTRAVSLAHLNGIRRSQSREPEVEPPASEPFLLPKERDILVLSTVVKLLLFPAYRSTDFEVHRNWLAITQTLPMSQWYFDTTSEWTLDYPPFFAYFEWVLSCIAKMVDPKITQLTNLNYDAWSAIAFQRTTVIVTELVMGLALLRFIRTSVDKTMQTIISASIFLHPSFLIVDHIHFQYNGFMFGILLWSILMARNGNKLMSGLIFAILLNFKHIYLYLAPAYFVYLLRSYCMAPNGGLRFMHFIALANVVIMAFALSFGPFAIMGQIPQVLSRLFPFTRGLNHAYWAPNAWALVTAVDRVLLKAVQKFHWDIVINAAGVSSSSRGLVGDTVFAVIPNVKPGHTFFVTLMFQLIFMAKLWTLPSYKSFVTALTLCGYASYMFGWHVHEKAIMLVLVPLSLLAAESQAVYRTFVLASVSGIFSLFPLIFTPMETLVKILYSLIWGIVTFKSIGSRVYEPPSSKSGFVLNILEKTYLAGFVPLQFFISVLPFVSRTTGTVSPDDAGTPGVGSAGLEFLPLMTTSVYCSLGLVWAFIRLSVIYLRMR